MANSVSDARHSEADIRQSILTPREATNRLYISLDARNFHHLATTDLQGFIDDLLEFVTIDEVQRVPELFLAMPTASRVALF